jgi:hypothetical protein
MTETLVWSGMGVSVRLANTDDIPWLVGECREFSKFFNTKKSLFPEHDTHAWDTLHTLIQGHPFFVAERDYMRIGFIAGALQPHAFNPDITVLTEIFWWVTEGARGTRAGAMLFHEFLKYGKAHADWIIMTLEAHSPVRPDALERRGFHLHESSYLLEV